MNDSISLYDLGVRNLHRSHGWDWIHAPGRSLKQFRNFESFFYHYKTKNVYKRILFQEAAKCPPVEYVYDMDLELSDGESVNEIVEVDYEYRYDTNVRLRVQI